MPKLIRLYIVSVAIGFSIALAFASALVWFDIANLRHLILDTEMGWLAFVMMVLSNGVVFSGVQFGIAVMGLAEKQDPPKGGRRGPARIGSEPIRVEATAPVRRQPVRRG